MANALSLQIIRRDYASVQVLPFYVFPLLSKLLSLYVWEVGSPSILDKHEQCEIQRAAVHLPTRVLKHISVLALHLQ